jgi:hypothetical protein
MATLKQIEANRRNALVSTGPRTAAGKQRSRSNALRHGLTAETVIVALEKSEDYAAFEMALAIEYRAQSVIAHELVVRLASVLWRLRRATAIETGLFEMQADPFASFRQTLNQHVPEQASRLNPRRSHPQAIAAIHPIRGGRSDLTQSFLRLASASNFAFDRLSRYETSLWRQADQIMLALRGLSASKR